MSYDVYTWKRPGETAYDCGCTSLLLDDTRKAWSMISLIGKGEHEGTTLTMTKEQLYAHKFTGECELAAFLDRKFELEHAWRIASAIEAQRAAAENTDAVGDESAGPKDASL